MVVAGRHLSTEDVYELHRALILPTIEAESLQVRPGSEPTHRPYVAADRREYMKSYMRKKREWLRKG